MDFTFKKIAKLLEVSKIKYNVIPYIDSINRDINNYIILRHDVDRYPNNTLKMAKLEANLGIKSSYYFRIIKSVFKPNIIDSPIIK